MLFCPMNTVSHYPNCHWILTDPILKRDGHDCNETTNTVCQIAHNQHLLQLCIASHYPSQILSQLLAGLLADFIPHYLPTSQLLGYVPLKDK